MATEFWDAFKRPPPEALKNISGGRLRGKTDINPQWRLLAMTETFGPVGIGWKYVIEKMWLEPAAEGEVCAFVAISLSVKIDGEWSAPIPGIGGSKLIEKEKSGPYTNDECYKMALTDALSVAMRALGVAADIYRGGWDGTKYRDEPVSNSPAKPKSVRMTTAASLSSADTNYLNDLKKSWLMHQYDQGQADNQTPKDILAKRFADFLPTPTTQVELESAWERLAGMKAAAGEITEKEEAELFGAVVASEMSAAASITSINESVEKLNAEYTSDAQAKVIFAASERRREEIRDGRGETSH